MHHNEQNCTILNNFLRSSGMPTNPLAIKAHVFAMLSTSLRDMQIPKYKKKFLVPLPNPGYAPAFHLFMHFFIYSVRIYTFTDVGPL